jgi:hypothetical protein
LTIILELVALLVSGSSPYTSLKLMAYSAPLLTLLVIGSRKTQSRATGQRAACLIAFGTALVNVLAVCLFLATTAVAMWTGIAKTRPATEARPAARAATALPSGKVILIAVKDTWDQVWLAYFLRDRPVAVLSPSVAFVGYSAKDAAQARQFDAQADFVIRELSPGSPVWRDSSFGIYAIKKSTNS